MAKYKLEVTTGDKKYSGTWDHVFVTLCGTEGSSERTELDNLGMDFRSGTTGTYTIKTTVSLGKLLLVKVEKDGSLFSTDDEWYCSKIVVTTPEGDELLFPCHRWVSNRERVELRGGRAVKVFEEEHPILLKHRKEELICKKSLYQWKILDEGLPHISPFSRSDIPAELDFTQAKLSELQLTKILTDIELKIKGMLGANKSWVNIEDMKKIFWFKKTTMSEYVSEHWKEDDFFGYQFLNGMNPNVIRRCSELPPNFPVTDEMVKPSLEAGSSLEEEMKKGRVFLYDQRKMDGIPGRVYNGETLSVTPGLCLFYLNSESKLMPIAIQLYQHPSEENPIFLPGDPETDWLLAKVFIKNADCMDHQAVHHLMNTHFLAEVFTMATARSLPVIHPLYKLLIPHLRQTLWINAAAREILLVSNGPLASCSLGYDGLVTVIKRSHAEMTYSSLCLPDNITARGLESVPNFHYRDDGLRLWNIINNFVRAVVEYYYPSDSEVRKDSELQEWIGEILNHGFLGNKSTGFPSSFHTVEELIKFITMVIFTVSAQHAAVNGGQFDYQAFPPNGSLLLRKAPPTRKGQSSMETFFETLPNVGETASFAAVTWTLSEKYIDFVPLGTYPEERFNEPAVKQMIVRFQEELSCLSKAIEARNSELKVPYTYLIPNQIENSVTI